jgi:uncharacterized membrane-anchored protein
MDARHFLYSAEVTNLERPRVATGIQSWFVVGGNGNWIDQRQYSRGGVKFSV